MKRRLFLASLVAAYLATTPSDSRRIADLHRLRDDAFRDDPPDKDEAEAIGALLRAAEVAVPTADAKAAAERLAEFLTPEEKKAGNVDSSENQSQSAPAAPSAEGSGQSGDGSTGAQVGGTAGGEQGGSGAPPV